MTARANQSLIASPRLRLEAVGEPEAARANVGRDDVPVMLLLLLALGCCFRAFVGACRAQHVCHGVVAFMAGILPELVRMLTSICLQRNESGERLGPDCRILDGEAVVNRVRSRTKE